MFFTIICVFESKSQDEWIQYKTADNEKLSTIKTLAVDSLNRVFFPSSQKIFMKNSTGWEILNNPEFEDERYYNLKSFYVSNSNIIWGASELGFMNYDIASDELIFFDRKAIKGDWDYGYLTGLTIDDSNNVWFTSRTPYLSKFDGEKFVDFDIQFANDLIKLHHIQTQLFSDSESNIWVAGNDGIISFSRKSNIAEFIYENYSLEDLGFTGAVSDLKYSKSSNEIWASSRKGEVAYYNGEKWEEFIIPDSLKSSVLLNGNEKNYIAEILIDKMNRKYLFWASSNYFLLIDDDKSISKHILPDDIVPYTISISSSIIDKDNNLWLGTVQDGLIKYTPKITNVSENENINTHIENLLPDIHIRKIYPNPTKGKVNVDLLIYPENISELKVSVINLLGVEILDLTQNVSINYKTGESSCSFNLDNFNQGLYLFCVNKGKDKIAKIIYKFN